jgi:mannose/fructose/N-acetylgalactosamine-specific phosphotransferase system component IID
LPAAANHNATDDKSQKAVVNGLLVILHKRALFRKFVMSLLTNNERKYKKGYLNAISPTIPKHTKRVFVFRN